MSKYQKNLVSVIIPSYKRAEKLKRAIESVLNQTYLEIELLVVNDNEKDDEFSIKLREIISLFTDCRLKLIEQEKHINGAVARNVGIKHSKGEYVAFLDDDNYWERNKIERQVAVLSKLDHSWGGVSSKKKYFNNDKFIRISLPYKSGKIYEEILLRRIEVGTSTLLLRHEALDKTGYFDETLNRHQELQLLTYFTYRYKLKLVNEFLHNADISDGQNRPNVERFKQVKKDFFNSVKPIIDTLPIRRQRRMYIMHNFELGYALLKNKQYREGIKKCLSVLWSPFTLYYAIYRSLERIIGTKLKGILLK
ncbi:glycosyltransferase family 2 protein [Anaerobacillus alkaliphilus]|uniref:Glycosyltransferase family 2 protein n=1 Tax=Anaerobacillus alkaliphilus TaxID=1548597 RepID=A0A4Q0VUY4_9BACI|nr:glycosyltransferase family 2 protein [Anaerobacillus alkaliphilus]RXJ02253.1 glycosyltransferase family 2 protein [Anaerobacillus alkaliphilus]